MGKQDDDKKVYRLTEIHPEFVSLVRAGANRQDSFMVVKSEEKRVPAADATNEDKQAALKERASKYGIEAREDAALSYPSGDPTTETLYADPVNLKYPLGKDDNERDAGRIRNALARFSQFAEEYKEKSSKVKILERIVEAALAEDIGVTYQEDDEIYEALPSSLRERIEEAKSEGGDHGDGGSEPGEDDLSSWLTDAGQAVETASLDAAIQRALDAADGAGDKAQKAEAEINGGGTPPAQGKGEEERRLREENRALKAKMARLSKTVGGATALTTGSVAEQRSDSKPRPSAFRTGRDMAAEITEGERK